MLEEKKSVLRTLVQKENGVRQTFTLFGKEFITLVMKKARKNIRISSNLQMSDHALNGHHPDVPNALALIEKGASVHAQIESYAVRNEKSNVKAYWEAKNIILTFFVYRVSKVVYTALTTAYVLDGRLNADVII